METKSNAPAFVDAGLTPVRLLRDAKRAPWHVVELGFVVLKRRSAPRTHG